MQKLILFYIEMSVFLITPCSQNTIFQDKGHIFHSNRQFKEDYSLKLMKVEYIAHIYFSEQWINGTCIYVFMIFFLITDYICIFISKSNICDDCKSQVKIWGWMMTITFDLFPGAAFCAYHYSLNHSNTWLQQLHNDEQTKPLHDYDYCTWNYNSQGNVTALSGSTYCCHNKYICTSYSFNEGSK